MKRLNNTPYPIRREVSRWVHLLTAAADGSPNYYTHAWTLLDSSHRHIYWCARCFQRSNLQGAPSARFYWKVSGQALYKTTSVLKSSWLHWRWIKMKRSGCIMVIVKIKLRWNARSTELWCARWSRTSGGCAAWRERPNGTGHWTYHRERSCPSQTELNRKARRRWSLRRRAGCKWTCMASYQWSLGHRRARVHQRVFTGHHKRWKWNRACDPLEQHQKEVA